MGRFIECCCTNLAEALEAQKGGASRIELCEMLEIGGVTPDRELVKEVVGSVEIPVNVLIRLRGGDFTYTEDEVSVMVDSILEYKNLGINAVVAGALDRDGNVDMAAMKRMIDAARPLPVTFHRAFDVCLSPMEAFEDIVSLGCERLLTSGHEADALTGSPLIAKLVSRSKSRIIVMPGCGIRPSNIAVIEKISGAVEFHSSSHGIDCHTDASVVSQLVNDF